ncbi:PKD domain-containing protein [Kitasatospora sp. NPDC085879]|uniref:PKD domain-containing protein n=1 Tax=Kitasatospora sp. NPDC085879 TaxID=3154769 RepID=UPI0034372499
MPSRATSAAAAIGVVVGATLVAAPVPASAAGGSTLYVNNSASANCSDSGAGAQTQPYCSPQLALDAARPGDTVLVSPGIYGPVRVTTSGTESAPITVVSPAVSSLSVELRGTADRPGLEFDHVHDVVFRNLTVSSSASGSTGVKVTGSNRVSLDRSGVRANLYTHSVGVAVDGASQAVTISNSGVSASSSAIVVAAGARDTVLTGNSVPFYGDAPAIQVNGAPGTVVVANTVSDSLCSTSLVLDGASTGAVVENNAFVSGNACTGWNGIPAVTMSPEAAADVVWDYNTIESPADWALYRWAGQPYTTPTALHTATGRGGHDTTLKLTPSTTYEERQAPLVDSADANAPHEPATDHSGKPRLDDPLIADTGTGPGWFDRGATELQDPYRIQVALTARKGPAPLTVTLTPTSSNPWNTPVTAYTVDFGDGTTPAATDRLTATTHTYTSKGTYRAVAQATLANGTTAKTTLRIDVVDDAPLVPSLQLWQPDLHDALAVEAIGNATSSWSVTNYTFDFGDGTSPQTAANSLVHHTYTTPGTYTVTMTVKDDGGRTATTTREITVGSVLVPVHPVRILDTRDGTGAAKGKVGPGGTIRLKVAGANAIPATHVTAVTLNLTGVNATAATYVTAYPAGTARPTASNLNLAPNQIVPNQVTVPVGDDGSIDLYNFAGTVDLVADVQGYYSTTPLTAAGKAGFVRATGPTRILDTRTGPNAHPVGPGQYAEIALPDNIAKCASAAVVSVTETQPTASSWVGVTLAGGGAPTTSVLNFAQGRTSANEVVVPVDANGHAYLYNAFGSVHLVADLQGYIAYTGGAECGPMTPYFPISPTRVLDTRDGTGAVKARLAGGSAVTVKVAGTNGVPVGAKAVLVNLTGIAPTTGTWLAAYPHGTARPTASNLNLDAGEVRPVLALVPVGEDGSIDLYNAFGTVDVAADIQGYYLG